MYFFTYKTTNLLNGKYYYGRRSTDDLNDGYLGSGIGLKRAVKKYGAENFVREILNHYTSVEELVQAEKELITEDVVYDRRSYNAKLGGWGGSTSEEWTPEMRSKLSVKMKELTSNEEYRIHHSNAMKAAWKRKGNNYFSEEGMRSMKLASSMREHKPLIGKDNPMFGRTHTPEARKKISEARLGTIASEETRRKIGLVHKGRPKSPETKQKMSEAAKLLWAKRRADKCQ